MPPRQLVRAFLGLYVALGLVVLIQSVETILATLRGQIAGPDRIHALGLGAAETLATILFLVPGTMRVGAVALLTIFALAFGLHAVAGDVHLTLLVYAAGVLFVHVHGVRGYRWQAAT
ncbi:MAG TPA: hypothetical protein VLB12_07155 [Gemmatimonadales bacterium]|nr:hypothetical protein [Gemmatimonadales bacterium]HSE66747.1 hypothetical protein [Gemmatimonadales bacterium]